MGASNDPRNGIMARLYTLKIPFWNQRFSAVKFWNEEMILSKKSISKLKEALPS